MRRYPFLMIGLVTFGLFLLVEGLPSSALATGLGAALRNVVRVLIIPLWGMATVATMLGVTQWPTPLNWLVTAPMAFAPYVFLDWALNWVRSRRRSHHSAEAIVQK